MKVMENKAQDIKFYEDELEKAKEYLAPAEMVFSDEDFIGNDIDGCEENFKEYMEDIKESTTLEELAAAWNKWTDMFEDGSSYEVREF